MGGVKGDFYKRYVSIIQGSGQPLALERVKLGGFMGRYNNLMRSRTLISQYELLESTGRLDNFRRAAGKIEGDFKGFFSTIPMFTNGSRPLLMLS